MNECCKTDLKKVKREGDLIILKCQTCGAIHKRFMAAKGGYG